MLPNTNTAIKNIKALSRRTYSENQEEEESGREEVGSTNNKFKLKEYRDMYLNARTQSQLFDDERSNSNSNSNSRMSENIYDTEDYTRNTFGKRLEYPFVNNLPNVIPSNSFAVNTSYDINVCVYRIFNDGRGTEGKNPFLQFKLLKRNSANEMIFPTFKYERIDDGSVNDKICMARGNAAVMRWFKVHEKDIKFKGFIKTGDGTSDYYLIYEETISKDRYKTLLQNELRNMTLTENWWWACVDEIFNKSMLLVYPVSSLVIELFTSNPAIMFLYDSNRFIYETPIVLYTGFTEGSSLEEIRLLGPRKLTDDNNIENPNITRRNVNENRMYGTQYYFYELDGAFQDACYTYDNVKHKYKKIYNPHMFRYVVFLGITKVTMFDTDNTTTNASIDGANTFHDTKWPMEGYDSIFHGKYRSSGHRSELRPVFSVFDNTQFMALSCHEVDVATVPSEFNETTLKNIKLI